MAYRYIYKDGVDFFPGMHHENFTPPSRDERVPVRTANDMDREIKKQIDGLYKRYDKIGILLSGGMDSAIVASYLKPGSNAYTFTSHLSGVYDQDIKRAKKYCAKLGLAHNLVDIAFEDYEKYTPIVMERKCAPVHSIEPQIYKAAEIAKRNGDEIVLVGESADLVFGGMDKLLSRDWDYDEFVDRYIFLSPGLVLSKPVDVNGLFEPYRLPGGKIDFERFLDEVFSTESSGSYWNAFGAAGVEYYDPYAKLIMSDQLDLERVRNGEPKYLVRGLYAKRYPDLKIPDKIPMPRPVDVIFENWEGPQRPEFRSDIDMGSLTGNQKWQLWCAEKFLEMFSK